MNEQGPADRDDSLLDDTEEAAESWLRRAAEGPAEGSIVKPPVLGDVVGGKYRIDAVLGHGGMGTVFRATHVVSRQAVAIKWLLCAPSEHHASRRFVREARAVARIDHPNVVTLFDVCQERRVNYLVMELLRGEPLRKRLARGPLDAATIVDLLMPAMEGVAAAHRVGVIHRDLKPDNIFLCEAPDGTARGAKVLDFGVSSIIAPEASQSTLTQAGMILGSPAYMSPEQIRNSHGVDARTDVYAFGVLLYEAVAGVRPFRGDNFGALILAIETVPPKPLSSVRDDLPAGFEEIVMRAFARGVEARYQDMASLIAALRPYAKKTAPP